MRKAKQSQATDSHSPTTVPSTTNPVTSQSGSDDFQPEPKTIKRRELADSIILSFGLDGTEEQKSKARANIRRYLKQVLDNHPVAQKYNIVILYDQTRMVQSDADNIYSSVTGFKDKKPILLVLHSSGGFIGPAYLIGKLLREYSGGPFNVAVPRLAKSGATLLCCAADHIHMGSLTELGPIDPQFEGLPALGLKSSIEHIAQLVAEYPQATELFAKYLSQSVQPIHLGYYERVAESAVQYAVRLLRPHEINLGQTPDKIAKDLVYSYKDHGFVIEREEAQSIFGDKVVQHNTDEYALANALYQNLTFISRMADNVHHDFYFIGTLTSEPGFIKRRK